MRKPHSNDPGASLRDIAAAIERIQRWLAGCSYADFLADDRTEAAVERMLLIISEAAIRLGERAPEVCPGVPWAQVRGTGNWLRHAYDEIDTEKIWVTATEELPILKIAVLQALGESRIEPS